jgi:nucleoid-associated protein YgaU
MANCPVCNKTGLPDFKTEEVICPQCNSNLKAFKLLSGMSARRPGSNKAYVYIGTISILVVILLWQILRNNTHPSSQGELSQAPQIVSFDSTKAYKERIRELEDSLSAKNSVQGVATVSYSIKKGDCLSKIAQMFYNDWRRFDEIEKINNLVKPYNLRVGQIIKVKVKTE